MAAGVVEKVVSASSWSIGDFQDILGFWVFNFLMARKAFHLFLPP